MNGKQAKLCRQITRKSFRKDPSEVKYEKAGVLKEGCGRKVYKDIKRKFKTNTSDTFTVKVEY